MSIATLLVATENSHKLGEMQAIFGPTVKLLCLKDLAPGFSLPEEGISSYEENAAQKAIYAGTEFGVLTLGDDSGFEVSSLNGQPGILSARFAGAKDSSIQRKEILRLLADKTDRGCKFVCVLAVYDPSTKKCVYFRGEMKGTVANAERGSLGFGYDSIVIPEGYSQTLGEISSEIKNKISHRALAISELKKQWQLVPAES